MGGKRKLQQRVKNNARPSSSGRSAELLNLNVNPFVGFSANLETDNLLAPGITTFENVDANIDSEFLLAMKQMLKKDPTTKVKALKKFTEFIQDNNNDMIKTILPLWAKVYQNLSIDIDHRVRESAQIAHKEIVLKIKKDIAPILKQILPVWLLSQYDVYAPAASISCNSFTTAFPSTKVQSVLIFAQTEILEYFSKNLTWHTATTLSNIKVTSIEDAETKYQRLVKASLKTFSFFVENTYSDESLNKDKIFAIIQNDKFWSFSKSKVTKIKCAWFGLILTILQHIPNQLETKKKQILQVCFQNMDDPDTRCLANVWDCILLAQVSFTDWQELIDIKKIVAPKLNSLLKNNLFNGTITAIGPNLLPFLSNLDENNSNNINFNLYEFYNNFFGNLKENLLKSPENSAASKSDMLNLVVAYFECFRFIMKNIDKEIAEKNLKHSIFAKEFIQNYLIDLIKWSMDKDNIVLKYINLHMSTLLAYWVQNRKESKFYNEILTEFWSEFWIILSEKFENQQNIDSIGIENLVNLIHSLYYATPILKSNRVKFNDNKNFDLKISSESSATVKDFCIEDMQNDLKILVIKFMKLPVVAENLKNYVIPFKQICKMFGDKEFYTNISANQNIKATLQNLIELLNGGKCIEEMLDIIFEINSFCENEQLAETIKTILRIEDETLQNSVLNRILSYPLCIEPEIQIILQKNISEIIFRIANNVVNGKSKKEIYLLHKCFYQNDNEDILINKKDVEKMIKIMYQPLENPEKYEEVLDTCGSFVSQMYPVICSNQNSTESFRKEIFDTLFKFSIKMQENDNLSEDTLWEITTAWQDSLLSKDVVMSDEQLLKCCQIAFDHIQQTIDDINIPELIKISDIITKLLATSTQAIKNSTERSSKIDEMFEKFFTNKISNDMFNFVENLCLYFEIITKTINTSEISLNATDMSTATLSNFLAIEFLKFNVIYKLTFGDKRNGIKIENYSEDRDDVEENEKISSNEQNGKIVKVWSSNIINGYVRSIKIAGIGESLIKYSDIIQNDLQIAIILELSEQIKSILNTDDCIEGINKIQECILENSHGNDLSSIRTIEYLTSTKYYSDYEENKNILLFEDVTEKLLQANSYLAYCNFVRYNLENLSPRSLTINPDMFSQCDNLVKASLYLSLIKNHSSSNLMDLEDRKIIGDCIKFITEISELQQTDKKSFIYNDDINNYDTKTFNFVIEFINLLTEATERFPTEFNMKNWDSIRIGLSSWVLSVSKNKDNYNQPKVSVFISAVYGLFKALIKFINAEKSKSSTQFLTEMIDEWENLFSKEVNLVLFKTFHHLVSVKVPEYNCIHYVSLLNIISPCIEFVDFELVYVACKRGMQITVNDLIQFSLENLQNINSVKISCLFILKSIIPYLIKDDIEILDKRSDQLQNDNTENWHFLNKFSAHGKQYFDYVREYNDEFSYKVTEISNFKPIIAEDAFTYFYYWDAIIQVFAKSSGEMRSIYATWVSENGFENFLNFLFRAMPGEVLKNFDIIPLNTDVFRQVSWQQIRGETISTERYACHLYTEILRFLPAMIRKWWSSLHTRQKLFIDKLTTNYVSSLIWQEDLKQITLHEKIHENMQIHVHQSTREVIASYSIDEARMDLTITLAQNYPLGGVKVETGKQIGGRSSSRNVGMQLTVFLMHQNGSIFDGLSLWKQNLDKKFAGVEECYVCYTVIHQDTCQLPKLTCKTCKKKFHGPCLYKWFTTSSKSTCPLCRNIF